MSIDEIYYIRRKIGERALLEQLAEECNELAHASLKMIRAKGLSENVTPVDEHEAEKALRVEAIHVHMIMRVLGIEIPRRAVENAPEWERWAKRLKETETK